MPVLWATIEHESGRGQRLTQLPLQPEAGLKSCTEKGVWCAGYSQAARCSNVENALSVMAGRGQRFLSEDVLSGA
jgi:hypothetical protein